VTTGPNTGIDVIAPGRQDMFLENHNPVFRSADISVAPPHPHHSFLGLSPTTFFPRFSS